MTIDETFPAAHVTLLNVLHPTAATLLESTHMRSNRAVHAAAPPAAAAVAADYKAVANGAGGRRHIMNLFHVM